MNAIETLRQMLDEMPDVSLREGLEQLAQADPVTWCRLNRKINGHALIFDNSFELTEAALKKARAELRAAEYDHEVRSRLLRHRPFQEQPMRDQHPYKNYMKGRQVGVSESVLNEVAHWLATHHARKWVVTFPRDAQLKQFSETRIAQAFSETPRIKRLLGTPNQVYTKKIGDSYLILRSAWELNLGEGVDADGVTLDELDRMKSGIEHAFRQSLASSPWGFLRKISTPTLPGKGIHAAFDVSDQQIWLVRCSRCNLEQEIEFPGSLVQVKDVKAEAKELPADAYAYLCRKEKCRGKLNRMKGRWVPRRPTIQHVRGYHMSQLIAPWISATEVMQTKIDMKWPMPFYNYVLGLPASGDDTLLFARDFEAACAEHSLLTERTPAWVDVCAGIDWGAINWVVVTARNVVNNRIYVIGVDWFEDDLKEELRSVKDVEDYLAPFAPDLILADAGYGKDRNAYLLRRFGEGRFYSVFYNPNPKNSRTFRPQWSAPEQARVLVDRTSTLKTTCRAVKSLEVGLPSFEERGGAALREHIENLVPMKEEDNKTGELVETVGAKGDDHLAHSLGYSLLAAERLSNISRFGFDLGVR